MDLQSGGTTYWGCGCYNAGNFRIVRGGVGDKLTVNASNGEVYITNNCSALSYTDRTPMASSLDEAKAMVRSHKRVAGDNGKLDHSALHPSLYAATPVEGWEQYEAGKNEYGKPIWKERKGTDRVLPGRNLSMAVSAANEVAAHLLDTVDALTTRIAALEKARS